LSRAPHGLLRNRHLQSILGQLDPLGSGAQRAALLRAQSRELLLDCGEGVRLQAFYSPQQDERRVAVLLHGWEGSADSRSILSLGATLYRHDFSVLRLNLRDHGRTHHLNREIFHSCRLSDVSGALRAVASAFPESALYLAGFSLGGNFLLRAASEPGLPKSVRGVAAISPVVHPERTLRALEQGVLIYRRFLAWRWARSLLRKQRAWPGVHDFSAALSTRDLRTMTAALVRDHTSFSSVEEYLHGYALTNERFLHLGVPCALLHAEDDPLIPSAQFEELSLPSPIYVHRTPYGGHCGFIERAGALTLAERFVLEQFSTFG
jgi:predicted alpha/beta-fold hydrolase